MLKALKMILRHRNQNRLLFRLLLVVVLCSTFFTLIATAIQLSFSYQRELNTIEQNFEFIGNSYQRAISVSLYKVNLEQLGVQLKGILQLTDMVYAEVRESRGENIFMQSEGDPEATRDMVREYPLSYRQPSGNIITYGSLRVAASKKNLWVRLWDRVLIILVTNGVKMFMASLCILLFFHYMLIRHVARIRRYLSGWNPNSPPSELTLIRSAVFPKKADELDDLLNAINAMKSKVSRYIAEKRTAINGLKASENQIRVITDALPVLISYIDKEKRYQFANKAYSQWFGNRLDQILGRHVKDVLGEDMYQKTRSYLVRALQGERVRFETELTKNESIYLFEVLYVPDMSQEEKISGTFALWYDLSKKIQKEMELKRHREELTHVSRLATMGELTASMAHELNQPLTAILSNAQAALRFMEKDAIDINEIKDILMDIVADDRRAGEVIKRLRSFLSRGEIRMKTWDFNEIIHEVVTLIHSDVVMKNVSLRMVLDPNLPKVEVDRIQMQQILLNLILNSLDALKKISPDSRTLTITSCKQDHGNIMVKVADSGVGFGAVDMARVFEPFFTTKSKGMGMGLSINRSIIEAHHGRIWAENAPHRGAVFCFSLPIKQIEHGKSNSQGRMRIKVAET